jgi:hypothetical protein
MTEAVFKESADSAPVVDRGPEPNTNGVVTNAAAKFEARIIRNAVRRGLHYLKTRKPKQINFTLSRGSQWGFAAGNTPATQELLARINGRNNRLTVQQAEKATSRVFHGAKRYNYHGDVSPAKEPFTYSDDGIDPFTGKPRFPFKPGLSERDHYAVAVLVP